MSTPKKKVRVMYMHTIDGMPAFYQTHQEAPQIVFVGARSRVVLCRSLVQIRREARATRKWRKASGYSVGDMVYGYCRVEVP